MDYIENLTFDEIKVGDSACLKRILTKEDIQLFAIMSGDVNPAHLDEEYAKSEMFHKIIAHGMWGWRPDFHGVGDPATRSRYHLLGTDSKVSATGCCW